MGERAYYDQAQLWAAERYLGDEDQRRRLDLTSDILPIELESLLDVGAGNGAFLSTLERRKLPCKLHGLERSQEAINQSICRAPIAYGSLESLPFDDESFDLVSALEVIEHLPHSIFEAGLREMSRVARRHVLVSVPYRERRWNVTCPYCQSAFHPYIHLRSFDEHRMERLFDGFVLVKTVYVMVDAPVLPATILHRIRNIRGRLASMPPLVVCPVCGYSKSQVEIGIRSKQSFVFHMLQEMKRAWPMQKQPKWIIALYRKVAV
jgi:hypothetical protein